MSGWVFGVTAFCCGYVSATVVFAVWDPEQQWRKAWRFKRQQRAARKRFEVQQQIRRNERGHRRRLSSRAINQAANAYLPPVDTRCPDCVLVPVGRAGRVRHELIRCKAHRGEHFERLEKELGT